MEPIPILMAVLGTSSILSKNLALASIVDSVSFTMEVPIFNSSSGSLKAICPFSPIPSIWRSIPPFSSINLSYSLQYSSGFLSFHWGDKGII